MCWTKLFGKKKLDIIPGQVDVIQGCDPSPEYLAGEMPTYTIPELIEHLEFRKSIHETYYGMIVQGEYAPNAGTGDANFHLWAIEGYENAIHYLNKLSGWELNKGYL